MTLDQRPAPGPADLRAGGRGGRARGLGATGRTWMTVEQRPATGSSDLRAKGLSSNSVGLLASVVLGISSIAPVYALTATLGPTVTEVGLQMPAVFLVGFVPMLLVAYGYRELNRVAPDCGTSFTWATKAFNPYVGWMAGWGALLATIIVLSNLAGVAVSFFYLLLGEITGSEWLGELGGNRLVNVLTLRGAGARA